MQSRVCLSLMCVSSWLIFSNDAAVGQPPVALQHDYIDDDDQRRLADLKLEVDAASRRSLHLTIAAVGPSVEPIGGYRGISGFNRYTAEELDLILREQHQTQIITQSASGLRTAGSFSLGETGHLLERRLMANGRIDFLHRTQQLPLSLKIAANDDSGEVLQTTILVNGQPRLSCRYRIQEGRFVLMEVQSLGHDGYFVKPDPRQSRFRMAATVDVEPPVSDTDWKQRDIEGHWVLMNTKLDESPESIAQWVPWLAQTKQFELLEWLAICRVDAFKSDDVGNQLFQAEAPQAFRVLAWHRNTSMYLGHGGQQAGQMLLEGRPGETEDWLKRNEEDFDNWQPGLAELHGILADDDVAPVDSSKYLPPLQPDDVFQLLDADVKAAPFGDRMKAEPGVVYEHQILRAINAVTIAGPSRAEAQKERLRKFLKHPSERIRIEAMLAYTFLLPRDKQARVDEFLTIVDDENESTAVREAALLAVSYQDHPSIHLKLHSVALDAHHPAWKSAVSRLGDVGKSYTISVMNQLDSSRLSQPQREILQNSVSRILDRQQKQGTSPHALAYLLRVASVARVQEEPLAEIITAYTKETFRAASEKNIETFRKQYTVEGLDAHDTIWEPKTKVRWQAVYSGLAKTFVKQPLVNP